MLQVLASQGSSDSMVRKAVWMVVLIAGFFYLSYNIPANEEYGMRVIMLVQEIRNQYLDQLMRVCSYFGFEFFFVMVPLLLWWGDDRAHFMGQRLLFYLMMTLFALSSLKLVFARPRPYWVNDLIQMPVTGRVEYSYPSGHAWASAAFIGLGSWLSQNRIKSTPMAVALIIVLLTCFSRVYFGVHYPDDILSGLLCGLMVSYINDLFWRFRLQDACNYKHWSSVVFSVSGVIALSAVAFLINFFIDDSQLKQQPDMNFGIFGMLGTFLALRLGLFKTFSCDSKLKMAMRILLGIPLGMMMYVIYKIAPWFWVKIIGPLGMALMLMYIAPSIFIYFGLVSPRSMIPETTVPAPAEVDKSKTD